MQKVGLALVLDDDELEDAALACGSPDAVAGADQHKVVAGGDVLDEGGHGEVFRREYSENTNEQV